MTQTQDFLTWRTAGIGASDIAGILGISPWTSPFGVWTTKVMPSTSGTGDDGSEAMRWGKLLEDAIISEAARRLRVEAYGYQTRCEHATYPWARATVDAFCHDGDTTGVIEAKTTGEPYWNELPEYYEAQVLWQLEVTGATFGWVAALHAGRRLSLWRVDADPALQRRLLLAARHFWDTFVTTGIPPAIDGSAGTGEALDTLYREVEAGAVAIDEHAADLAALRRVRGDIKTLEQDAERLTNVLKAALGRADAGTVDGRVAVTWKPQHSRRIDQTLLREKYPVEAAECETVTEYRRFVVKALAKSDEGD